MTYFSAVYITLTPTKPVGSGRPQRVSNPGPPHQESRAPPTELPRPPHIIEYIMCVCLVWEEMTGWGRRETVEITKILFHFHGLSLTSLSATKLAVGFQNRVSDNFTCCHTETGLGDYDFCLSQSHHTDTDPTRGGATVRSGDRTQDLLTRSRTLYRLSYKEQ